MPSFSRESQEKLNTCHPILKTLFWEVIRFFDCKILEGHRSPERQLELYNAGRSKVRHGKHNETPSHAVDAAPHPIVWPDLENRPHEYIKDLARFYYFAGHVVALGKAQGINIRWGGDWDRDNNIDDQIFDDLVHFEIKEE
jgi:peptidoglycan L-alanyl-D-glutamate endopeptidase CwlK